MIKILCPVVVLALVGGCASSGGEIKEIKTASDLQNKMDNTDVYVVNALNAENYASGHVPGSVNIEYQTMTEAQLPRDKTRPIVFYCGSAQCPVSKMAAKKAAGWGYENVYVYEPGMKGWRESGMRVSTGSAS